MENIICQFQVSFSTWEQGNAQPHQDYTLHIDSASAIMRNPFAEKNLKTSKLSRIFGSSNSGVKSRIIEVNLHIGENKLLDRWLVVLSKGSGQSQNMARGRYKVTYYLLNIKDPGSNLYALMFISPRKPCQRIKRYQ